MAGATRDYVNGMLWLVLDLCQESQVSLSQKLKHRAPWRENGDVPAVNALALSKVEEMQDSAVSLDEPSHVSG